MSIISLADKLRAREALDVQIHDQTVAAERQRLNDEASALERLRHEGRLELLDLEDQRLDLWAELQQTSADLAETVAALLANRDAMAIAVRKISTDRHAGGFVNLNDLRSRIGGRIASVVAPKAGSNLGSLQFSASSAFASKDWRADEERTGARSIQPLTETTK